MLEELSLLTRKQNDYVKYLIKNAVVNLLTISRKDDNSNVKIEFRRFKQGAFQALLVKLLNFVEGKEREELIQNLSIKLYVHMLHKTIGLIFDAVLEQELFKVHEDTEVEVVKDSRLGIVNIVKFSPNLCYGAYHSKN